jgi:hypothetical protein
LITKCFTTANKTEYQVLKDYRKELLANKRLLVTDFGVLKSSHQTEKSLIAMTAGITQKRAELLFRITTYFEPDTILENVFRLWQLPWP